MWSACSVISLIFILQCLTISSQHTQNKKVEYPNLVVIITDEHNLRTLGCYRDLMKNNDEEAFVWGPGVKVNTPHLDLLAKEGALFGNFYSVAPVCTPSRASLMTGMYPKFTGAFENHLAMNSDAITFAEILQKKAGYHTGYVGKWHLNGDEKPGFGNYERPFGFHDIKYQFNRGHWKIIEEDEEGHINPYEWEEGNRNIKGKLELKEAYATDFLFERAFEYMTKRIDERHHFALVLSIPDPHGPNYIRAPYDTMFDHLNFKLPRTAVEAYHKQPANPGWASSINTNLEAADQIIENIENDKNWQQNMRNYFGMVKLIDDKVGKLMALLKKREQDENTIVVFTSDHGDLMGEHGHYNKGKPYKTSAGVPFIIRYPGHIMEGKKVMSTYTSPDFVPTILSIMGIDHSDMTFHGMDGSAEIINGTPYNWNKRMRFMTDTKQAKWAAAVDQNYKLVLGRNGPPILFDLKKDPNESINFYLQKGYETSSKSLKDALILAMGKYEFSLANNTVTYLDYPQCFDTRNQIPSLPHMVCNDLDKDDNRTMCELQDVKRYCPETCGYCVCKDSGDFLLNGEHINCDEATNEDCMNERVADFCQSTCRICAVPGTVSEGHPSSSPSGMPSSRTSSGLSVEPTMTPSIDPSEVTSVKPRTNSSSNLNIERKKSRKQSKHHVQLEIKKCKDSTQIPPDGCKGKKTKRKIRSPSSVPSFQPSILPPGNHANKGSKQEIRLRPMKNKTKSSINPPSTNPSAETVPHPSNLPPGGNVIKSSKQEIMLKKKGECNQQQC